MLHIRVSAQPSLRRQAHSSCHRPKQNAPLPGQASERGRLPVPLQQFGRRLKLHQQFHGHLGTHSRKQNLLHQTARLTVGVIKHVLFQQLSYRQRQLQSVGSVSQDAVPMLGLLCQLPLGLLPQNYRQS